MTERHPHSMLGGRRFWGYNSSVCLIAVAAAACSRSGPEPSTAEDQPQPTRDPVPVEVVATEVASVSVVAESTWTGDPDVLKHTTPVRLIVENQGASPLRLLYQDFRLIDADERTTYAALPPFEVDGETEELFIANPVQPLNDPLFQSNDYYLFQGYGALYPHLNQYPGSHPFDMEYYRHYYAYWKETSLPTTEMLLQALPEGVVETGGRVDGYIYFERVTSESPTLMLEAKLTTADNIPLGVARVRVDNRPGDLPGEYDE